MLTLFILALALIGAVTCVAFIVALVLVARAPKRAAIVASVMVGAAVVSFYLYNF